MSPYCLSRLNAWTSRSVDLDDPGDWLDLLDDFGPSLLRFLIDESWIKRIPTSDGALRDFRSSLEKAPLSSLQPTRGSVWVLFAYRGKLESMPAPFRRDGLLLPFCWTDCQDEAVDGDGIPICVLELSEQVRTQFGAVAQNWRLRLPDYFRGAVDLRLEGVTCDSAWGALASGLWLAINRSIGFSAWPYSSIAFDFSHVEPRPVGSLAAKIRLAASLAAEEIAFAPCQRKEAERTLAEMRTQDPSNAGLARLSVYDWKWNGDVSRSVAALIRCNQPHHRQRIVGLILNLLVLALAAGLLGWYWQDGMCEHVRYFGDYAELRGIPVGLFPLKNVAGRPQSYKFVFRGYDSFNPFQRNPILRDVWCVNGEGKPMTDISDLPEHRRVAGRRFSYENRKLATVRFLDESGNVIGLFKHSGKTGSVVDVVRTDEEEVVRPGSVALESAGKDAPPVRRIVYDWDDRGFLRGQLLQSGLSGHAAVSGNGIARIAFAADGHGRIVETRYLTAEGASASDAHGISRKRFVYEGADLVSRDRFASDGRLCDHMDYMAGRRSRLTVYLAFGGRDVHLYDEQGRCRRTEYQNADGTLATDGQGVAVVEYSYDSNGVRVERLLDKHGQELSKEAK